MHRPLLATISPDTGTKMHVPIKHFLGISKDRSVYCHRFSGSLGIATDHKQDTINMIFLNIILSYSYVVAPQLSPIHPQSMRYHNINVHVIKRAPDINTFRVGCQNFSFYSIPFKAILRLYSVVPVI